MVGGSRPAELIQRPNLGNDRTTTQPSLPVSLKVKAAAIAYMWKKMEALQSIESFHYHRWVDHPLEGGLRLGLRTLADDDHPFGVRKEPAFTVFAAMETPEAATTIAPLKSILGIEDWQAIQVPLDSIRRD